MDLFGRKAKAKAVWLEQELQNTKQSFLIESQNNRIFYAELLRPMLLALCRVIAKDKAFMADINDPDRKAESDTLASKAIARLWLRTRLPDIQPENANVSPHRRRGLLQ